MGLRVLEGVGLDRITTKNKDTTSLSHGLRPGGMTKVKAEEFEEFEKYYAGQSALYFILNRKVKDGHTRVLRLRINVWGGFGDTRISTL